MRRVRVRNVIELASGLFDVPVEAILNPKIGTQSVVRDAAVLVAHLHCEQPIGVVAGVFGVSTDDAEQAIGFGTEMLNAHDDATAYGWRADLLHRCVVRLKAAWRREAWMARWRAAQAPAVVEHARWTPRTTREAVELTRSRMRERRSIWAETTAPAGAESNAT